MARTEAQKTVDATVESILENQKAPKARKEKESDDVESTNGVAMFDSVALKKHVDAVMKAIEKKDQANADVQTAYAAADKAGIPVSELKFLIKNRKKKLSEDFKANVNIMNEMLGDLPLFAFLEKADFPLVQHH